MKKKPNFTDRRLVVLGVLIVLIFLMMNFGSRLGDNLRLAARKEQIQATVTMLASTEEGLKTQVAYATSEEALIEKLRGERKYIKPGDVPVVPVSPSDSTPQPTSLPAPTPEQIQNYQRWMALFFGEK
jgi:cell division protein FtsB